MPVKWTPDNIVFVSVIIYPNHNYGVNNYITKIAVDKIY